MKTNRIVKLDAGIPEIPGTATYGLADRSILIRRQFDGVYTWRVLRVRSEGGYEQVGRYDTLRDAKASLDTKEYA